MHCSARGWPPPSRRGRGRALCPPSRPPRPRRPGSTAGADLPRYDVAIDLGLGYGHGGPGTRFDNRLGPEPRARRRRHARLRARLPHGLPARRRRAGTAGQSLRPAVRHGDLRERLATRVPTRSCNFRWAVARGCAAELGLELRAYLPIETGSSFGMMFGVPFGCAAGIVRIDTGVYVPVIFYDPTLTVVSMPVHLWIQASTRLARSAVRAARRQPGRQPRRIPAGLRPRLEPSPSRRSAHLVPLPRHGPQRGSAFLGRGIALAFRFE